MTRVHVTRLYTRVEGLILLSWQGRCVHIKLRCAIHARFSSFSTRAKTFEFFAPHISSLTKRERDGGEIFDLLNGSVPLFGTMATVMGEQREEAPKHWRPALVGRFSLERIFDQTSRLVSYTFEAYS